jgi:large subunit ribosomal protein L21
VYAIIEDGAHQYKVSEGDTFDIQRHDLDEGQETFEFDKILMIGDGANSRVGQPYVDGAKVLAKIRGELKGRKIDVIKFRRRKGYRRKQGHRQNYIRVTVEKIEA